MKFTAESISDLPSDEDLLVLTQGELVCLVHAAITEWSPHAMPDSDELNDFANDFAWSWFESRQGPG